MLPQTLSCSKLSDFFRSLWIVIFNSKKTNMINSQGSSVSIRKINNKVDTINEMSLLLSYILSVNYEFFLSLWMVKFPIKKDHKKSMRIIKRPWKRLIKFKLETWRVFCLTILMVITANPISQLWLYNFSRQGEFVKHLDCIIRLEQHHAKIIQFQT